MTAVNLTNFILALACSLAIMGSCGPPPDDSAAHLDGLNCRLLPRADDCRCGTAGEHITCPQEPK